MIKRLKQVELDDVQPGMVLGAPVLGGSGEILLEASAELTQANLSSLRRRGIDRLSIVDDFVSAEELEAERTRIELRLEHLFRRSRAQGASDLLLQWIRAYRIGNMK